MPEKIKIPACIALALLTLSGAFLVSHMQWKNCISYYDKSGAELLYRDCK